jgi:ATP-binding cassette, subfamily B (MDR/TAP), member 1
MGLASWFFMFVWGYTGEINAKRIRERYLQAILRQDIAFFDNVGAGEVATRIQTDTRMFDLYLILCIVPFSRIIPGLQIWYSKVFRRKSHWWCNSCPPLSLDSFVRSQLFNFQSTSSFSFSLSTVAYIRSWRLALALTSIFPCIAITGTLMNRFVSKWMQMSLGYVAEGGSLAEEVISTIRTAQAFGSQKTLSHLYDKKIGEAKTVDMKAALTHGVGLGFFFFVIYSAYGLGNFKCFVSRAFVDLFVSSLLLRHNPHSPGKG